MQNKRKFECGNIKVDLEPRQGEDHELNDLKNLTIIKFLIERFEKKNNFNFYC